MAQYQVTTRKEQIDVIKLSQKEFQSLNSVYRDALLRKIEGVSVDTIKDMNKIILTDGTLRIELVIEID